MANYRTVRVEFWDDPWVETLAPDQKLLYLYLFTCKHVNNLGVLEVSRRKIAFETGLSPEQVDSIISYFVDGGKVVVTEKYLWAVKFIKHQANTSPKIITSLGKQLETITDIELVKAILSEYDTLSIPYPYPIHTLPGKGRGKGIGKGKEEREINAGARIYVPDEEAPPEDSGPQKTTYPSKGRPSYRVFMSCLQIYEKNEASANEDSAWRMWCEMEDRGMLAEDIPYIRDLLIGLFQDDDKWRDGFAPSFTNCIRDRAWRNKPSRRPPKTGQQSAPDQPKATTQAQKNSQDREGMATALLRSEGGPYGQSQQGNNPQVDSASDTQLPSGHDRPGSSPCPS